MPKINTSTKEGAKNNALIVTGKPPRNVDLTRASVISSSGVQPETIQEKNNSNTQKNLPKNDLRKQSFTETPRKTTNDGSNTNIRSNDEQTNNEILHSDMNAFGTFAKQIPGRKSFMPNQINKIYPMRSTSFSSEKDTPKMSLSPLIDNRPSLIILNDERENYLKKDIYPKFPQQQNKALTENTNNKNAEENASINSSEIRFKQRTSPDGVESAKPKESEEEN